MNVTLTRDHDGRLESESEDGVDHIGPRVTFEILSTSRTIGSTDVGTRACDGAK